MKKSNLLHLALGIVLGGLIFGGAAAYAAGVIAQQKTAAVVIDGKAVDLKGYLIEGSHYFQLRDLSAALEPSGKDFSVAWDGQNNRVVIDTSRGYIQSERLPAAAPAQTPVPLDAAMSLDDMKLEIIRLTNIERVKAGLPELQIFPALMDSAAAKADDMRDNNFFSHTSPVYGEYWRRLRTFVPSARWCTENLGTSITLQGAMDAWMLSPGHRANVLDQRATHIGVGVFIGEAGGYWWVVQFAQL